MEIIDAHVHFWDRSKPYNGWLDSSSNDFLGEIVPISHSYLPGDYLADINDFTVRKAIHIEAASPMYAAQEVEWLVGLTKLEPLLQGVVAGIELASEQVTNQLSCYSEEPLVKGVRDIIARGAASI